MSMMIERRIDALTIVKVQGATLKEAFENLCAAQSVLGETVCGACKTAGAVPRVKHINKAGAKYVFYEMACQNPNCKATLGMWANDDGTMYPNRKNKDKTPKANGGWEVYVPQGQASSSYGNDGYQEPPAKQVDRESDIPF